MSIWGYIPLALPPSKTETSFVICTCKASVSETSTDSCQLCGDMYCVNCHTYCEVCHRLACSHCAAGKDVCKECEVVRSPLDRAYIMIAESKVPVSNPDALIGDGKTAPPEYLYLRNDGGWMLRYNYRNIMPVVDNDGKTIYTIYQYFYSLAKNQSYVMCDGRVEFFGEGT